MVSDVIQQRVKQLYHFLKEANQLRYRPIRRLSDQLQVIRFAEMPEHPSVQFCRPLVNTDDSQASSDVLLCVQRPIFTPCPQPPQNISSWLLPQWDDPTKSVVVAQSKNVVRTEAFDNDVQRVNDFDTWCRRLKVSKKNNMIEPPPASIADWLKDGWDNTEEQPEVAEKRNVTVTVRFDDNEERVKSYQSWEIQRNAWVEPELLARKAMSFYERFYNIYTAIEKDSEGLELLVADGHLQWLANSEIDGTVQINHPVLLKRVEIRFDSDIPQFVIYDTDREVELYSTLFTDLQNISPALRNRTAELEQTACHPLGWDETTVFLKIFIQTLSPVKGEFCEEYPNEPLSATPRLYRDMVLFLRQRSTGIANAVNNILEDIEQRTEFPAALMQITGSIKDESYSDVSTLSDTFSMAQTLSRTQAKPLSVIDDNDILLAKSSNAEQLQIIKKLEQSGSVIVQGPPGTGKTHTIGNLIGHLLAQGKSVLVTAHTAKALRVVREQMPEMLQPLAVSVLGSDQNARKQLELSISSITERMTNDSADTLQQKAAHLDSERRSILERLNFLKQSLQHALENEYKNITVGKVSYTPTEAARYVKEHKVVHSWIPSPIRLGAELSLTESELSRLYALAGLFSVDEEIDARKPLPTLSLLPSERQFEVMVREYQTLITSDLTKGKDRWHTKDGANSEELEALANELFAEFSNDLRSVAWRPYAIVAGIHGGTERAIWEKLIQQITETAEAQLQYTLILHHKPVISDTIAIHQQSRIVGEICAHVQNGGKIGLWYKATKHEWWQFIKTSSVSAGQPHHIEHFKALQLLIALEQHRNTLETLWNECIGQYTNQPFRSLGTIPEQACRAVIPEIQRCLNWYEQVWLPLTNKLQAQGLLLDELLSTMPRPASQITDYVIIETLVVDILPSLITGELGRRKLAECETTFQAFEQLIVTSDSYNTYSGCSALIVNAFKERNPEAYQKSLEYTRRLYTVKPLVDERDTLLAQLQLVAPMWAEQIANRIHPHDKQVLPNDSSAAWIWRQLNDELVERDKLNPNDIQQEIEQLKETLRTVTVTLIDTKAWGQQLQRLQKNNAIRQSLVGWLDTTTRMMSTRQKERHQELLLEARKLMKKSAEAVPVWIMPISMVAENFDARSTHFDVVIIDEASQADLNALIPLYLGKKIIVVGDNEQVTPLGVGENQVSLDNLRKQMLQDIPNAVLFDNKFSIYDIGRQSFGDGIRLVEHFRCVPEIIAFSNQLSYDGKIRPLREAGSSELKPACISDYLPHGFREKNINQAEAQRIVDLIKAMIVHPKYVNKTIGVIPMVGNDQATFIETLIHKEIPDTEIAKRRILVGSSSEFQGDERNIIFLSMVDSSQEEGPMRLTGYGAFELTKKRYNVATSRARDQLWVIHSFDPTLHLKLGDIRLQLLQHIRDPLAALRAYQQEEKKAESPFERAVLKHLIDAGYRVKTQWEVGYYRIDMVVEGGNKRLAIECDGERFHPIEKLKEDIERQTVLERLGWQFVRIRGSAFYRDAEAAMRPLFAKLEELEIPKEGNIEFSESVDMSLIYELEEIIKNNTQSSKELFGDDISELF